METSSATQQENSIFKKAKEYAEKLKPAVNIKSVLAVSATLVTLMSVDIAKLEVNININNAYTTVINNADPAVSSDKLKESIRAEYNKIIEINALAGAADNVVKLHEKIVTSTSKLAATALAAASADIIDEIATKNVAEQKSPSDFGMCNIFGEFASTAEANAVYVERAINEVMNQEQTLKMK